MNKDNARINASEVLKLTFRLMVQNWEANSHSVEPTAWMSHREMIESSPRLLKKLLTLLEHEIKVNPQLPFSLPRDQFLYLVKSRLEADGTCITPEENSLLSFLFAQVRSIHSVPTRELALASAHH